MARLAALSTVLADTLAILLLGTAALVVKFGGIRPYQRGFYCYDTSIRHPYKSSTISSELALTLAILVPTLYILTVEAAHYVTHNLSLARLEANLYHHLKLFLFGAAVTGILTSLGKLTIGRLRPHFLAVCAPDMEFSEATCGPPEDPRYVTDFTCTGGDAERLEDARLSFPSGHASMAFYSSGFTLLYLGHRVSSRSWASVVLLNQVVLASYCWYCALTRVSDYKHHATDVLAGAALGLALALAFMALVRRRGEVEGEEEVSSSEAGVRKTGLLVQQL